MGSTVLETGRVGDADGRGAAEYGRDELGVVISVFRCPDPVLPGLVLAVVPQRPLLERRLRLPRHGAESAILWRLSVRRRPAGLGFDVLVSTTGGQERASVQRSEGLASAWLRGRPFCWGFAPLRSQSW